jgi:hypothetical protein
VIRIGVEAPQPPPAARRASPLILLALPIALFLATVPVPLAAWKMIQGFQAIATSGSAAVKNVGALLIAVDRRLLFGTVGAILLLAVAATMQVMRGADSDDPAAAGPVAAVQDDPPREEAWADWFVLISSTTVLPVAVLVVFTQSIPRLIMETAAAVTQGRAGGWTPPGDPLAISQAIASRLVIALIAGAALSLLLLCLSLTNGVLARLGKTSDRFGRIALAASFVTLAAAGWQAFRLLADLRWFQSLVR